MADFKCKDQLQKDYLNVVKILSPVLSIVKAINKNQECIEQLNASERQSDKVRRANFRYKKNKLERDLREYLFYADFYTSIREEDIHFIANSISVNDENQFFALMMLALNDGLPESSFKQNLRVVYEYCNSQEMKKLLGSGIYERESIISNLI